MQRFLACPAVKPVGVEEFRGLLSSLFNRMPTLKDTLENGKIGVAVSGGTDSIALCLLAQQVIPQDHLVAFIVDHRLSSKGVTENPSFVSETLQKLGIKHEIIPLDWSSTFMDALTKGKLQERTRQMRYSALFKACRRHNVPLLLTGHNLDDDIVTMFYRLAHLSGLDGLAAMKASTTFPVESAAASRFFIGHPLLPISKARLEETCKDWGLQTVRDESNEDLEYRRNSIAASLRKAQEANPTLTTESLARMLNNFKRIRSDIHEKIVQVFDKSVIVNKVNGDCTLILNDESWLRKRYLVTRLLILLMQYAAANRYPASTPSVNALYNRLLEAFEIHQEEKKAWLSKMPASLRVPEGQLQPFDKTKRVAMQQHTLANCAFYSLSRVDAMRRIALQGKLEKRQLEYGPAFLIQRDPPSRSQIVASREPEITLGPTDSYLWDDRIYLSFEHVPTLDNPNPSGSRTFKISFMQPSDVKEFEALTKSMPSVRRRVYAFLGTTPGTHLYQIPVVKEVGADYTAFPTLKADFPVGKYKWKTSYAGTSILASRFLCLP